MLTLLHHPNIFSFLIVIFHFGCPVAKSERFVVLGIFQLSI